MLRLVALEIAIIIVVAAVAGIIIALVAPVQILVLSSKPSPEP